MPDGNVKNFLESELDQLEKDFLSRIKFYLKQSKGDIGILVGEIDFFTEVQEAGLSDVIAQVEREYGNIIEGIVKQADKMNLGVSGVTLNELETLMNLDADSILNSAKNYSNQFQSTLIKGFITGQSTTDILSQLDNIPLKTNQLIAAVNTAKDQFQAASVAKLFEDQPDVRYKLKGPVDNRTRCQCKAVMMFQPGEGYTKQEIDDGSWTKIAKQHCPTFEGEYTFINRGGYNCRHFIQVVFE